MRGALLVAALLASGCVDELSTEGRVHKYVINTVTIPDDSDAAGHFGLLLNSNRAVMNIFGRSMAGKLPLQLGTQTALEHGVQMQLVELQATNFDFAVAAGVTTRYAAFSSTEPCFFDDCGQHLDGDSSFTLEGGESHAQMPGQINSGTFLSEPGTQSIELSIDGERSFRLPLLSAQLQLKAISEGGIGEGVISGAIPLSVLSEDFVDEISRAGIRLLAECTFDSGCHCPAGSAAARFLNAFGTADSCVITEEDIRGSVALASLLHSDVRVSGIDAVSFGIGFTAIHASY